MITLPVILKYMQEHYNITQTELILLMIINNVNRNEIKIKIGDIKNITGLHYYYLNKLIHSLKDKGYITLKGSYQLTNQGRKVLRYYNYIISNQIKTLDKDTIISFADYSTAATRRATYNYKVKNNIIKQPEKSKYHNS